MLVFIHINKTAGSTVRYILRSTFGPRHCEVEPWHARWTGPPFSADDLQRLRKLYPDLESIGGHRLRGYVDLGGSGIEPVYFTFMRDPLKTCASRFQYNVQYRGKTELVFEQWIQQDWPRNAQTRMIAGKADVDEALRVIRARNIFVGLTERFDESMVLLRGLVANRLNIAYKRVNVARSNTLAQELLAHPRTHQMLVEANQADLALYDCVRSELYPALQRDYGPSLTADVAAFQAARDAHFNYWNLTLSRLKQYAVYRPLLQLYRRRLRSSRQ